MPRVIAIGTNNSETESVCRKEENKARSIFFPHMPSKQRGNLYPRTKFKWPSQRATSNETAHKTERFGVFFWFESMWMIMFFYFGIIWFSEVLNINNYSRASRSFITSENQAFFLWWRTMWIPISLFSMLHTSQHLLGKSPTPPTILKNTILFYRFKKIIVFFSLKKKVRLGKHRPLFKIGQLNQIDPIHMFLFSLFLMDTLSLIHHSKCDEPSPLFWMEESLKMFGLIFDIHIDMCVCKYIWKCCFTSASLRKKIIF